MYFSFENERSPLHLVTMSKLGRPISVVLCLHLEMHSTRLIMISL